MIRRFLNWLIPVGYQDATGFHYGQRPSRSDNPCFHNHGSNAVVGGEN